MWYVMVWCGVVWCGMLWWHATCCVACLCMWAGGYHKMCCYACTCARIFFETGPQSIQRATQTHTHTHTRIRTSTIHVLRLLERVFEEGDVEGSICHFVFFAVSQREHQLHTNTHRDTPTHSERHRDILTHTCVTRRHHSYGYGDVLWRWCRGYVFGIMVMASMM